MACPTSFDVSTFFSKRLFFSCKGVICFYVFLFCSVNFVAFFIKILLAKFSTPCELSVFILIPFLVRDFFLDANFHFCLVTDYVIAK